MEAKQLKRDVEALINDYIGQRLRERCFDPKGRRRCTPLDLLAHYDLAFSVALWWLDREDVHTDIMEAPCGLGSTPYPNYSEREAMILSSLAGILIDRSPVDEIRTRYRRRPATSYKYQKEPLVACSQENYQHCSYTETKVVRKLG